MKLLATIPALAVTLSALALPAQQPVQQDFGARYTALARESGVSDSVRLHRIFDLGWEYTNTEYPEYATYSGYSGQNDRWTDLSVRALERRQRDLQPMLAAIRAVNRSRLSAADQLSFDLSKRGLEEAIEGNRFPRDVIQVTQMGGPQYLAATIGSMPAATAKDYGDMITRIRKIPAVVDQTIALLDSGLKGGVTPPRITLRNVVEQIGGLIVDDPLKSPLLAPFTNLPASIAEAERSALRAQAADAYNSAAKPAFTRLRDYLATTYVPRSRETIAMGAMPDGAAWYAYNVRVQTTTNRTPREIHDLGLSEVKRIRAQMDSVIRSTAFTGNFAAFTTMLRTDPKFYYRDSASLVRAYRDISKRIDPELTKLFGRLPRLPYGISTVPSYAAPSQTTAYYQQGSPDSHRAGQFFVNTYRLETRPMWEMEPLSAHEAVPGHHLQIAISQELEGIPKFRRYGGYTAFEEGWALYSESLGPELGLYTEPYSKFGQLTYEMWRAIRLVVDTGIHAFGWTRQEAIDFFKANSAKTENDITVEVDRYIVWPGQALAYKSGELKIKELRKHAEDQLGSRFDIRGFHDQVLGQGALPLDILDTRIRGWVAAEKSRPRQ